MAGDVHDMTGRSCKICGHAFSRSSMNLTLTVKSPDGFYEKQRVCGAYHSAHHAKGE